MSNFDFMFYVFDFKEFQIVYVEVRSMRQDFRIYIFVKVFDGQYRNIRQLYKRFNELLYISFNYLFLLLQGIFCVSYQVY